LVITFNCMAAYTSAHDSITVGRMFSLDTRVHADNATKAMTPAHDFLEHLFQWSRFQS